MYSFLLLWFASSILALLLTPLFRNLYIRLNWLDRPDGRRKIHKKPVPRAGGLPIALSYLGSFALVLTLEFGAGRLVQRILPSVLPILAAALLVLIVGILDDILGLEPWQKFAGQFAAAALAWFGGVQVHSFFGASFGVWLSLPATLFWLVACSNAFNLIDGLDGLAAGIGFFASATMLAAALISGNLTLAYATAPLVGALLGFLRYNFNPASVFLGDSGSLTIGFLLGCFGVVWARKSETILGLAAPFLVLSLPLLDTALAIVRRFLRRQPIFSADRGHIHHRLLDRGLSVRAVALVLYGVCGLAAVASLLTSALHNRYGGLVLLLFCAAALFGIRRLKYAEFSEARRILLGGFLRRTLGDRLRIARLETDIAQALTPADLWSAISEATKDLRLSGVTLLADGELHQWSAIPAPESWQMIVPLGRNGDVVHLSVPFRSPLQPTTLAALADALRGPHPAPTAPAHDAPALKPSAP